MYPAVKHLARIQGVVSEEARAIDNIRGDQLAFSKTVLVPRGSLVSFYSAVDCPNYLGRYFGLAFPWVPEKINPLA